jgi:hypothetical protein
LVIVPDNRQVMWCARGKREVYALLERICVLILVDQNIQQRRRFALDPVQQLSSGRLLEELEKTLLYVREVATVPLAKSQHILLVEVNQRGPMATG